MCGKNGYNQCDFFGNFWELGEFFPQNEKIPINIDF